ncbi:hypothetical protein [Desulfofalx alkaliphila]|uniref:hypothetical protein n=1 Tax=Desulfofalx alkaliphila TaxID=105483 RepID=UPI0004E0C565|nr:hypothetical protein [Desulfofalx alkaliphila]
MGYNDIFDENERCFLYEEEIYFEAERARERMIRARESIFSPQDRFISEEEIEQMRLQYLKLYNGIPDDDF